MDNIPGSSISEKLKPEYFFLFEYLVNAFHVIRIIILIPSHISPFLQGHFQCTPNKTMERHLLERLQKRCYEDYATPFSLPFYWDFQLGMACFTVMCYYIPSWWIIEHKEMSPKVRKGVAIGYLMQTILQICIEVGFIVVQAIMYGFHIPSEYLCQNEVANEEIRCEVLLVDVKLAFLGIMFVLSVLVTIFHMIDLRRTIKQMCYKRKIDDLLPIFKRK
ncbi:unnamed protein product, partial [Owenia fusiformis]